MREPSGSTYAPIATGMNGGCVNAVSLSIARWMGLGVNMGRTLREIEYEIEMLTIEMSRTLIAQSSMDEQLSIWDRRLKALGVERDVILSKTEI